MAKSELVRCTDCDGTGFVKDSPGLSRKCAGCACGYRWKVPPASEVAAASEANRAASEGGPDSTLPVESPATVAAERMITEAMVKSGFRAQLAEQLHSVISRAQCAEAKFEETNRHLELLRAEFSRVLDEHAAMKAKEASTAAAGFLVRVSVPGEDGAFTFSRGVLRLDTKDAKEIVIEVQRPGARFDSSGVFVGSSVVPCPGTWEGANAPASAVVSREGEGGPR